MGLDVIVFKGLKKIGTINPSDYESYYENHENDEKWIPGPEMEWSESIWTGRGEPYESYGIYDIDKLYHYHIGSYSTYNWWRNYLEQFVDNNFTNNTVFQELIDFADNEGVIGSVVSEKLYNDFSSNNEKAKNFSNNIDLGEKWLEIYYIWEEIFYIAKDNGAVEFC